MIHKTNIKSNHYMMHHYIPEYVTTWFPIKVGEVFVFSSCKYEVVKVTKDYAEVSLCPYQKV